MDKKTIGIIALIATIFLCALPGLAGLCFGSLAVIGIFIPDSSIPSEDTIMVAGSTIMAMGLSLLCIAVPIAIGTWLWWSQKTEAARMEKLLIPEDDF